MSVDFGCIAWHEDGRWSATTLASTRDIGAIIDALKAQQTNGGAIALIAIDPEEEDESQPGGDLDLLNDLGVSEMELLTILDDTELYPDEQLEAIANRLGFGDQFNQVIESN